MYSAKKQVVPFLSECIHFCYPIAILLPYTFFYLKKDLLLTLIYAAKVKGR